MMRPWQHGLVDEWLPRRLRLAWGGDDNTDGGGFGGDSAGAAQAAADAAIGDLSAPGDVNAPSDGGGGPGFDVGPSGGGSFDAGPSAGPDTSGPSFDTTGPSSSFDAGGFTGGGGGFTGGGGPGGFDATGGGGAPSLADMVSGGGFNAMGPFGQDQTTPTTDPGGLYGATPYSGVPAPNEAPAGQITAGPYAQQQTNEPTPDDMGKATIHGTPSITGGDFRGLDPFAGVPLGPDRGAIDLNQQPGDVQLGLDPAGKGPPAEPRSEVTPGPTNFGPSFANTVSSFFGPNQANAGQVLSLDPYVGIPHEAPTIDPTVPVSPPMPFDPVAPPSPPPPAPDPFSINPAPTFHAPAPDQAFNLFSTPAQAGQLNMSDREARDAQAFNLSPGAFDAQARGEQGRGNVTVGPNAFAPDVSSRAIDVQPQAQFFSPELTGPAQSFGNLNTDFPGIQGTPAPSQTQQALDTLSAQLGRDAGLNQLSAQMMAQQNQQDMLDAQARGEQARGTTPFSPDFNAAFNAANSMNAQQQAQQANPPAAPAQPDVPMTTMYGQMDPAFFEHSDQGRAPGVQPYDLPTTPGQLQQPEPPTPDQVQAGRDALTRGMERGDIPVSTPWGQLDPAAFDAQARGEQGRAGLNLPDITVTPAQMQTARDALTNALNQQSLLNMLNPNPMTLDPQSFRGPVDFRTAIDFPVNQFTRGPEQQQPPPPVQQPGVPLPVADPRSVEQRGPQNYPTLQEFNVPLPVADPRSAEQRGPAQYPSLQQFLTPVQERSQPLQVTVPGRSFAPAQAQSRGQTQTQAPAQARGQTQQQAPAQSRGAINNAVARGDLNALLNQARTDPTLAGRIAALDALNGIISAMGARGQPNPFGRDPDPNIAAALRQGR